MQDSKNPFLIKSAAPKKTPGQILIDIIQYSAIILVILIVLFIFVVSPNQVDGYSMYPTYDNDEILLSNRLVQWFSYDFPDILNYDYQRGDVIVFYGKDEKPIVKRIIGLPGDTVSIVEGKVYVNNNLMVESYLEPDKYTSGGDLLRDNEALTVSEGSFFVLGDNRDKSIDSRFVQVGLVSRSQIIGKVFLRLLPLNKLTFVGTGDYVLLGN